MIKRIELKNFMSHQHTVIDLADGLTVLIGPNNVGKSAIIAALQILCYNDNSTYVMRHGAKSCSVTVETSDGHIITWQRKAAPSYLIDGKKFDRLGNGGVPEELHQLLRLPRVEGSGQEQFDVHFGVQKSPIFLLDSTGSTAARFFASSSDAIRLVEMQKRHQDNVREAKMKRRRLEQESARVNAELEALEPVTDLEGRLDLLEQQHREIGKLDESIRELTSGIQQLQSQLELTEWRSAEVAATQPLQPLPTFVDTTPLEQLLAKLNEIQIRVALADNQQTVLAQFSAPPSLSDVRPLEMLIDQIRDTARLTDRESRVEDCLNSLPQPPTQLPTERLEDSILRMETLHHEVQRQQQACCVLEGMEPLELQATGDLEAMMRQLEECWHVVQRAERDHHCLQQLPDNPEVADTVAIKQLTTGLSDQIAEIERLENELSAVTASLESVMREIREFAAHSSCPLCGAEISAERLVSLAAPEGHQHG